MPVANRFQAGWQTRFRWACCPWRDATQAQFSVDSGLLWLKPVEVQLHRSSRDRWHQTAPLEKDFRGFRLLQVHG